MSILRSKFRLLFALLAGMFTLATPSLAIPVSGILSIGGSSAEVGATFLNFVCKSNRKYKNIISLAKLIVI